MKRLPHDLAPATDEIPGLARVEQLVLRGDGLTSTSLQILTGDIVSVQVRAHWVLAAHDDLSILGPVGGQDTYTGVRDGGLVEQVSAALTHLRPSDEESLLVREVLLTGAGQRVWGASTVVAVLDRLPASIVTRLATTDEPIGRALHESGTITSRELRTWGLQPAGRWAGILHGQWSPDAQVPAREYLMRLPATGTPLAHFVEWFSPAVFDATRRA